MELVPNRRRRKPRYEQMQLPIVAAVDRQRTVRELQRQIDRMQAEKHKARRRHPSSR